MIKESYEATARSYKFFETEKDLQRSINLTPLVQQRVRPTSRVLPRNVLSMDRGFKGQESFFKKSADQQNSLNNDNPMMGNHMSKEVFVMFSVLPSESRQGAEIEHWTDK